MGAAFCARDVEARADKALFVDGHGAVVQPVRVRIGANKQEDAAHGAIGFLARLVVAPAHLRQAVVVTFEGDDFRMRVQSDVGRGGDALDQIARHAGRQTFAADHHVDFGGVAGEKHGRLAGRIAAADEDDLFLPAQLGFDGRGPVIHAPSLIRFQVGQRGAAIARAARQHHGASAHLRAVAQIDAQGPGVAQQVGGAGRRGDLDAELLRLHVGASRQRAAGDAGGKTQVVFDARAGTRLTAVRALLERQDR
ncbi:hypothetical protein D3C72_1621080 [compost metagenome]